mmetsp:Transcript_37355/g.42902  ORF Transcript_37355/g.42902 Transcript_37355/m.42902 type:complete len:236 (-) Transcript_37355:415-1122(-)
MPNQMRNEKPHEFQDKMRPKEMNFQDNRMPPKDQRGYYKPQGMNQPSHSDSRMKPESNYGYSNERVRANSYEEDPQRIMRHSSSMSRSAPTNQQSFLHNPLANSGSHSKMKSVQMVHHQDQQSMDQLDIHQNPAYLQDNYIMSELISMPNPEGEVMSHLDQYLLPQNVSNPVNSQGMSSTPAYMSSTSGVQSLQMGNVVQPNPGSGGRGFVQYTPMPASSPSVSGWGVTTTGMYN